VKEKKQGREGMNRSTLAFALASCALLTGVTFAVAQQSGTAAEAKAMFERAVGALKANEATALAAFNDKNNKEYHDRDLYVFCYNMTDGSFTAHVNSAMIGKDVRTIKVGDDSLGQRIFDVITKAPEGAVSTVEYKFPKPGTTEPVPKESYVTRIANQGCGVGYYK
jgi:cytochrome c